MWLTSGSWAGYYDLKKAPKATKNLFKKKTPEQNLKALLLPWLRERPLLLPSGMLPDGDRQKEGLGLAHGPIPGLHKSAL
jgi:hypothetical protein